MAIDFEIDVDWCTRTLRRIYNHLAVFTDGRDVDLVQMDAHYVQLQLVYREIAAAELLGEPVTPALESVRQAIQFFEIALENHDGTSFGYEAQPLYDEAVGRPRYDIAFSQLSSLLEWGFTVPQISNIVGVSIRTVRRRMTAYNLTVRSHHSQMSDLDFDAIVAEISAQFPTCGNRQMQGYLNARGVRVQQHRVREAQRRIDPSGSMIRRLSCINRRTYQVNGPLALLHIDGNHKLIR